MTLARTLVLVAGLVALVAAGCGGGDDAEAGTRTPSTGGVAGGPEPRVDPPSARYAPFLEDLDRGFEVYPPEVFGLSPTTWGLTGPFPGEDGEALAEDMGYIEGYQVQYNPQGLLAEVLQGSYYLTIQTHVFRNVEGATEAFAAYRETTTNTPGAEQVSPRGLGNEWVAYALPRGTVGNSDVVAVFHRFVFRRGNVVAWVQTYGAEPFMTIDAAREVAVMIDNRVLGNVEASEPTPIPSVVPADN
jgi:hypothetical protein